MQGSKVGVIQPVCAVKDEMISTIKTSVRGSLIYEKLLTILWLFGTFVLVGLTFVGQIETYILTNASDTDQLKYTVYVVPGLVAIILQVVSFKYFQAKLSLVCVIAAGLITTLRLANLVWVRSSMGNTGRSLDLYFLEISFFAVLPLVLATAVIIIKQRKNLYSSSNELHVKGIHSRELDLSIYNLQLSQSICYFEKRNDMLNISLLFYVAFVLGFVIRQCVQISSSTLTILGYVTTYTTGIGYNK